MTVRIGLSNPWINEPSDYRIEPSDCQPTIVGAVINSDDEVRQTEQHVDVKFVHTHSIKNYNT